MRSSKLIRSGPAILLLATIAACLVSPTARAETAAVRRASQKPPAQPVPSPPPKTAPPTNPQKIEGLAVWYDVPPNSLAQRRAGKNELTAAHNRLPFGTKVRVTHLANGKSVVVRITDRGITKRRALIDLCKAAAEKLGMLREGSARVRLEILPDDRNASVPRNSKTSGANP